MKEMLGKTISHYKIIEILGHGGMGVVYKAEDTKLRRTVALKFISPEKMKSQEFKERLLHEAQAAAALDHPNIGTVYEIDEAGDQIFLAMSYIKGISLRQRIENSPLRIDETLDITLQITEGLQEAHEKGIIHRDIKSSNIMITEKGQAIIMDFGLAKLIGGTKLTETASIMGTAAYMSPEQALGNKVDHRTDIWSLGVMIYEMLTGQYPFQSENEGMILRSILEMNPPPVTSKRSGIPLEFEAIIEKCLEKDPNERYQNAADLKADLKRLKRKETAKETERFSDFSRKTRFPYISKKWRLPAISVLGILFLLLMIPAARQPIEKILGLKFATKIERAAILPFSLIGTNESDQAFSNGLMETVSKKLIGLERFQKSLWILPLEDVYQYEITDPRRAHRVFKIPFAVTGNFKRMDSMFTLTLNLIDTRSLTLLKSRTITDQTANISTLQEGVVIHIAEMLGITLSQHALRTLRTGETTILSAFRSCLEGIGTINTVEKPGGLDQAIACFEQAVQDDPHYALALIELSRAYLKKHQQTKDPVWFEKAEESCHRATGLNQELSSAYVVMGTIYKQKGNHEDAVKNLQQAIEIDPNNYNAFRGLADTYENMGQLDEAINLLKKFISLKPGYWSIFSNLGYFYYHKGNYQEAEKMYRRSTELMTENVNDYNNLMAIYYQLGDTESARTAFEKSVAIKPDADTYANMGTIYFYQRRYADAMEMYEEAIELGEDEYYVWSHLADSRRFAGYKEKAPEAYKHAIHLAEEELKIKPNDALLYARLAAIYAKVGCEEKALDHIEKADKLAASNNVVILLHTVLVFEITGDRDQALLALKKYLQQNGSMEEIRGQADLSGLLADPRCRKLVGKETIY